VAPAMSGLMRRQRSARMRHLCLGTYLHLAFQHVNGATHVFPCDRVRPRGIGLVARIPGSASSPRQSMTPRRCAAVVRIPGDFDAPQRSRNHDGEPAKKLGHQTVDITLSAVGCAISLWILSWLDRRFFDVRFYAPPFGAVALLLFASKKNNVASIAACTCLCMVASQGMCLLSCSRELARGVVAGACLAGIRFLRLDLYPPSGALALLFLDSVEPGQFCLRSLLCPALSGHLVIVPLAIFWLNLRGRVALVFNRRGFRVAG